ALRSTGVARGSRSLLRGAGAGRRLAIPRGAGVGHVRGVLLEAAQPAAAARRDAFAETLHVVTAGDGAARVEAARLRQLIGGPESRTAAGRELLGLRPDAGAHAAPPRRHPGPPPRPRLPAGSCV